MSTNPNNLSPVRIAGLDGSRLNDIMQQVEERRQQLDEVASAVQTLQRYVGGTPQAQAPAQPQQTQSQPQATTTPNHKPRTRTMSPAARKQISETMKKRWAERNRKARRGAQARKTTPKRGKQRTGGRPLSAAAKAKISAKQKERWANLRARESQGQQPQAQAETPQQQQVA